MMNTATYPKNETGRTMFETILYISFMVILGGVLATYISNATKRYKIGRAAQQLIDLKKSILEFSASDDNYERVTYKNLKAANAIPLEMQTGNADKGKHALGGFIQIWPAKKFTKFTGSNNKYMYFIVFENLSQAACVELLTQGQFYGDGSDLDTIVVNRNINNFKNNSTSGIRFRYSKSLFWTDMKPTKTITLSPNKPSVTINDAFTACSKKTGNSILWVFS